MELCSHCKKGNYDLDLVRCIHEECGALLCNSCITSHTEEHQEPAPRTCFDPECEGCFNCSDLSLEEYNEDPMGDNVESPRCHP